MEIKNYPIVIEESELQIESIVEETQTKPKKKKTLLELIEEEENKIEE